MGNFGKLNFSVSFDRTSAFPLDGNSYFTSYSDAELAASSAVEVGSSDSAYYIGQMLTVVEGNSSKNYIIQPDKTLSEVGSGSGSPEVAVTNGEEPQGDEVLWVDMNEDTSSSLEELGIQPKLESGVNIKTINGESILGKGDIVISSSGDGESSVLDLTEIPNAFTTTESTTISDELYSKIQEAYNNGVKLCLINGYGDTSTKASLDIAYLEGGYILNIEISIFIGGYIKATSVILVQSASSVSIVSNQYIFPINVDGGNNSIRLVSDDRVLDCSMEGYSKPSSYSAIIKFDSISKAIGKLEAGIIPDAPSDGRKYVRMNGEWVKDTDDLAIIEIDQTISDPATMIGGNVNGFVIQWIRKNSHRVLAKKTGEGTVTYIELDDNNSNKYAADGSEAKTDGTEGDVFVKLPTFYYKGTEGDKVKLYFSLSKIDDDYVEWDTNILIGAYEAYNDNSKLYSKSGVESSGSISQAKFKSYAAARGSGYQLVDWQMHCVLGCLFYAMYGNTNSQAICGSGTDSNNKICGETNSLGMNDTKAETNGNTMSINFWGLENWWGDKAELMEGIESTAADTVQILSPDPSSGRTFTWYNDPAYGKRYRFGKYLDLSSDVTSSGSNSTYYCDTNYGPTTSARVVNRSHFSALANGGVSRASVDKASSALGGNFGSRLAFRGTCTRAESVEAFKSLPVL